MTFVRSRPLNILTQTTHHGLSKRGGYENAPRQIKALHKVEGFLAAGADDWVAGSQSPNN